MTKLRVVLLCLLFAVVPATAFATTLAEMLNIIATQLPTNTTGSITASALRGVLNNLAVYANSNPSFLPGWDNQVTVNLNVLGADPTGVVDAAPLINTTAASLASTGGVMTLDAGGTYKIGSTLRLGNGTSSSGSTIKNIRLEGRGNPGIPPNLAEFDGQVGGARLLWSGGASPVVSVRGPIQGWGVSNLYIDCNGTATNGLEVISAQLGQSHNVSVVGCQQNGVVSTTVPTFGSFTNTDSFRNYYYDFFISVPNVGGAKGVNLTSSGLTANTDYNSFFNLTTWQLGTAASYGLYLAGSDSNFFYFYKPVITGGSNTTIAFDYTLSDFWPAATMFFGTEPGIPVNIGSPTLNSRPNTFYGVMEANGNPYPTNLANVQAAVPAVIGPAVDLTGQLAALSLRNVQPAVYRSGMYRIDYYLGVTTNGSAGNLSVQFQWSDGAVVQNALSGNASATTLGYASGSFQAYVAGGTPVNFQTNFAGVTGSPAYQLHIRLERLD